LSIVIGLSAVTLAVGAHAQAPSLAERAAAIDRVLSEREGFRVVVGHISRELGSNVDTLREQRAKRGLTWGEMLVAHRLSREAKVSFDQIVTEFRNGQAWEDIARAHAVDLGPLTQLVQRSQLTMEQRADDKPPPHTGGPPSVVPPSGGAIPLAPKQ